jgi:hypothetical protein
MFILLLIVLLDIFTINQYDGQYVNIILTTTRHIFHQVSIICVINENAYLIIQ